MTFLDVSYSKPALSDILIEKFVSNMIFGGFDVVSRRVSDKSKARRGACKVLTSRRLVILLDDIIDKPLRAL